VIAAMVERGRAAIVRATCSHPGGTPLVRVAPNTIAERCPLCGWESASIELTASLRRVYADVDADRLRLK
jgi:hypothetical protein